MQTKIHESLLTVENLSSGKILKLSQGATLPGPWSTPGIRLRVTAAPGWLQGTVNERRELVVSGWAKPALRAMNFPPRFINLQTEASTWL